MTISQKFASVAGISLIVGSMFIGANYAHAQEFDLGGGGWSDSIDLGGGGWSDSVDLGGGGWGDSIDLGGGGWGDSIDLGGGGWNDPLDLGGGGYLDPLDLGGGGYDAYDVYDPYDVYDVDDTYSSYPTHSSFSNPVFASSPVRVSAPVSAPQSVRSNPVFAPTPAPRPQPIVSTPVSNVTTNTCVGNSCNTNINNSINGSFNDNSVNGSFNVTTLTQATPQRPIQYVFPQQNLSCVIVATPNSVQSGQTTTLSWSSFGATSAWLSDNMGTVNVNGSRIVNPISSRSYSLTISGMGGTQTCTTYVTVANVVPSVSLSQIPYTGFGGGPLENALYFGGLLAFAASAAYLVLYFKGGAGSVLGGLFPAKAVIASTAFASPAMFTSNASAPRAMQKLIESETVIERLPSLNTGSLPKDSMSFAHGANGGIPRIVVTRS